MTAVVFRRLAEQDVREARRWYSQEDRRLGAAFAMEVRSAVQRLREAPRQYPEVREGVQRALLHRFPYAIYFQQRAHDIVILAVLHQRRRPDAWQR